MRIFLLATTNPDKVREIRALLAGADVEIVGLDSLPPMDAPEETGTTFAENARLKARYYATATGLAAIAEDSGLEIDALDGAPGVESARFGGARSTYPEKFAKLYDMLDARGGRDSAARFVCALAVADGDAHRSSKRAAPSKAASRPLPAARTASATTRSSSTRPRAARWPKCRTK